MLSWIARGLLLIAGLVTGWWVAKDAVNFSAIQMTVAILIFVMVLLALALSPRRWADGVRRIFKRGD